MYPDDINRRVDQLAIKIDRLQIMVDAAGVSYADRVAACLRRADLSRVRLNDVVEALDITNRKLTHQLIREGVQYREIMDQERRRRVEERLRINPMASCHELTEVAGYSNYQNLIRAFRRWFGTTLAEYKAKSEDLDT